MGKPIRGDSSPTRRISRMDSSMLTNPFNNGSDVSIFELLELITKHCMETSIGQFILEDFKPLKLINEDAHEYVDLEQELLELAILKITAKCSRFGFDQKFFVQTLDDRGEGKLTPQELLDNLKSRFNVYLS